LLRAGADKVAINTAAIKNPQLISQAAQAFGSQCIVASIQAKQRAPGKYECLTDNARESTGVDVFEWAKEVVSLGAGEILLTSVDRDGTGQGYDVNLVSKVSQSVSVSVIAYGGAGKAEDVIEVIQKGRADAVCASSIFHYRLLESMTEADYSEEGNVEFLKMMRPDKSYAKKNIHPTSIPQLKECLQSAGINCRLKAYIAI